MIYNTPSLVDADINLPGGGKGKLATAITLPVSALSHNAGRCIPTRHLPATLAFYQALFNQSIFGQHQDQTVISYESRARDLGYLP